MPSHLVNWSGGPDSTYVLVDRLERTSDPVVTVTVGATGYPQYTRASMRATKWLEHELAQRYRPFKAVRYGLYAENAFTEQIFEITSLTVATAMQMEDPVLYWGRCAEDVRSASWQSRNPTLVERARALAETVVPVRIVNADVPKTEMIRRLGDLWPLTWTCLYPSEDLQPCGRCDKCAERRRAERAAAEQYG